MVWLSPFSYTIEITTIVLMKRSIKNIKDFWKRMGLRTVSLFLWKMFWPFFFFRYSCNPRFNKVSMYLGLKLNFVLISIFDTSILVGLKVTDVGKSSQDCFNEEIINIEEIDRECYNRRSNNSILVGQRVHFAIICHSYKYYKWCFN